MKLRYGIAGAVLILGLAAGGIAAAIGDGETGSDTVAADGLVCDDDIRVIFHGDYRADFVGYDTPEEAVAVAAVQYGTPTRAADDGSLWLIHDDQGRPVGKIAVVAAPAGGFIAGDHTLCGHLEPHDPE
ncbi:MAG: hypothetical protein V3S38_00950 [Acidimicrobiia bacterium]